MALTAAARELTAELGFAQDPGSISGKPCMDWSERDFHVAGELGLLLLSSMLESRWFLRRKDRSLVVTEKGRRRLTTYGLYPWATPGRSAS